MHNEEMRSSAVLQIHSGVGTSNYTFIWAMGGESMEFDDMDNIASLDLRGTPTNKNPVPAYPVRGFLLKFNLYPTKRRKSWDFSLFRPQGQGCSDLLARHRVFHCAGWRLAALSSASALASSAWKVWLRIRSGIDAHGYVADAEEAVQAMGGKNLRLWPGGCPGKQCLMSVCPLQMSHADFMRSSIMPGQLLQAVLQMIEKREGKIITSAR